MRQYYLYILASKRNGTLYVGVTNDLNGLATKDTVPQWQNYMMGVTTTSPPWPNSGISGNKDL